MRPTDLIRTPLRTSLLQLAKSGTVRDAVEKAPVTRGVVKRFVPGSSTDDAVRATAELQSTGRMVTLDFLGEDTLDLAQAQATRDAYLTVLRRLSDAGATAGGRAEVSLKLTALGQLLPGDGRKIALEHAREVCEAAAAADTTVTLDMEDHTTTDATLEALREIRVDFPWVGAVLQAYLHRTEADCRDLAHAGSRVRLCKGAYNEPASVAFQGADVDRSYVRCLKVLMAGEGYPMVASHDPRLIEIAGALAAKHGRDPHSFEYQMLFGIRPEEQQRLADRGDQMRVYVPYGDDWYGYFMRRLAERPANVGFFLRGVATRG
ncbi:proline dehydrogenase family protein [Lapillicoccus jejuensis]|uniref:proline dehydrogenase n=1 Tax=Lapillicoccus jejuensis TaxID=402171 RepID=A0A542DXB0_9MICO|nr:proline dehydrogenase family protein [Lapillicoccus jejuensis]TQJ07715.1 L-proline dehydrogenase [Lapillicoccus jejuensis]